MATSLRQLTLFDGSRPARRRKPKARATVALPEVSPPDLRQETALWLCGQRSIEAQRGRRYVPRSVQHPGKMWPDVAGAIIDTYTQPGDVILDPMGGIGTTAVEAAERGRHVVTVEIVPRWARVAWCNALRTAHRGAPGTIRVLQGDARRLPELVAGAFDTVVTSPPYGEALEARSGRVDGRSERLRRLIQEGTIPRKDWNVRGGLLASVAPEYSPGADAVITSPPYGPTQTGRGMALTGINGDGRPPAERGIGVTYDAVVTSPVYGESRISNVPTGKVFAQGGGLDVANLPRGYDAMITSPAYGDIRQDGGGHQFGGNSAMTNYTGEPRLTYRTQRDRTNVGNLRYGSMDRAMALIARLRAGEEIPETEWPAREYLDTMALIYWHCLQLLRPGGLAILVLKDYRRDKQRVDLVGDTIQIMTAVGFRYHDQALALISKVEADETAGARVVPKVSPFVRINARKPERNGGPLMLPTGEVVLVFRKGV